jgi:hypothetical protein
MVDASPALVPQLTLLTNLLTNLLTVETLQPFPGNSFAWLTTLFPRTGFYDCLFSFT